MIVRGRLFGLGWGLAIVACVAGYAAAESTSVAPHLSRHPIVLVLVVAVAAPLLAEIPIGLRVPIEIFEVLLGIVIGPHVLGLARADNHAVWPDAVASITRPYLFLSARCVR